MNNTLDNHPDQTCVEELTYEQALAQLEEIVDSLESGERPLEQILDLFERGQALTRHCSTLLDQAEIKVKQLSNENLVDFEIEE
jgi:exodeoxyribonuclease VII small subunit